MPFSSVFRVLTCPPNIRQYEYVYCDVNLPYLLQGLVGAVELCVCLLEEGGPELGGVRGVEVDEPALVGGQPVVDEHLDPVAKVPEPEPEHAAVAVLKVLLGRIPMTQVSVYLYRHNLSKLHWANRN